MQEHCPKIQPIAARISFPTRTVMVRLKQSMQPKQQDDLIESDDKSPTPVTIQSASSRADRSRLLSTGKNVT